MGVMIMVGQLVLSLSILIVLHEMGHFLPARLFDTRVEKFYLFFDPWFSLFKVQKGETEYGIGWLPLGGYVKISGMIDESLDKEQMKQPPQPWEFRSKPAWQRLIIMLGGVTVNFILGFLIFGMVLGIWGEKFIPNEAVTDGIFVDSLGMQIGLQDGDMVLGVDTIAFEEFGDRELFYQLVINKPEKINIKRDGRKTSLPVPAGIDQVLATKENKGKSLYGPRMPFIIGSFPAKNKPSPGRDAGLQVKDKIVSIDGVETQYYHEFKNEVQGKGGQSVNVGVVRDRDSINYDITLTDAGTVGIFATSLDSLFGVQTRSYTAAQALPAGFDKGVKFLGDQFKAWGKMFRRDISVKDNLGGFRAFATLFGTTWDWERFWNMTAIISLILAFMNLLPIPALDGGHVMFLLYEVVTGRKPSDQFMEYATIVGFVLVLSLVIYANYLDWF
ncbi:MAG: RIP metalloprotease RseP [Saprospiraceae bacterium]|nr:RIP metalloprotease RseP [Saprospiraceae bacterium]